MQRIVGEGMIEQTYLYAATKFNKYDLEMTYTGEVENEECEYYNIQISVNTDKHIADQLSCISDVPGLMDGNLIPSKLQKNSLV